MGEGKRGRREEGKGINIENIFGDHGEGAVTQWLCARNTIRKVTSSTPPALRSTQNQGVSITFAYDELEV
ncbi:hypothetical protein PRIPAC_81637 [Pristionchus pacificus]|uniref:Uncharacterized protein n=1 Tax=Pristionchus pacificus TaxID=54126 RepID=A0A2A6CNU6_PRIPA|nr:hypothetical protein PRIPAC_81637 [Pristionchus pacificus]|eukprot:PDM79776.1 hypothetical protein PRIPAC_32355 [Pristionchus pacificus]